MTEPPPRDAADLFDEAGYLRLYPGVAEAIMRGEVPTARAHYDGHGQAEGRRANDVDAAFYFAAYPAAALECPDDAAWHFVTLGRARGYLPNARAPRPPSGGAWHSPFGGFWTDHADALDRIAARQTLGRLRAREAALLRAFALDGIVTLDRDIETMQLRDAAMAVSQCFAGRFDGMRFQADRYAGLDGDAWSPMATVRGDAALDPHMFSGAVRAMLFDAAVILLLTRLFDAPVRLTASRAWLRRAAPMERDVAFISHSAPLCAAAVTFMLDELPPESETVWPGSHLLADVPFLDRHVTLSEALRLNPPGPGDGSPGDAFPGEVFPGDALRGRQGTLARILSDQPVWRLGRTKGARTLRHVNLVHAAHAPDQPGQGRMLTAWYCPSHVMPLWCESRAFREYEQDGVTFCSGVYPAIEPVDDPVTS